MPKRIQVIPEVQKAVTRPVAFEVIRQLFMSAGVDPRTPIRYQANGESIPMPYSQIGPDVDPTGNPVRLPTDQMISIEVVEDYNENFALSEAVLRPEQPFIFIDPKLNVFMKPYYKNQNVEVSVTFRAGDYVTYDNWRRTVKQLVSRGTLNQLHHADYQYVVPLEHMYALLEIHRLREAQYGYGENCGTWLHKCFTPKYTKVANQAGRGIVYAIREGQTGMIGGYDFGHNPPKAERDGAAGGWTVSFTYKFNYDRPEGVVLLYPMIVHNQPLADHRYDRPDYPQWYQFYTTPSNSTRYLDRFRWSGQGVGFPQLATPGVAVPYFDDWLPTVVKPNFQKVLQVQLQVNPDNLREIVSVGNMGIWTLAPDVQHYLQIAPITAFQLYESIFNFEIHRWRSVEDPNNVIVTQNLDITNLTDLDPRQSYHLVINMLMDPTLLSAAAVGRLAQNSFFAKTYLSMLWPGIDNLWPDGSCCGAISVSILRGLIQHVAQHVPMALPNGLAMWSLVMAATIQTYHRSA